MHFSVFCLFISIDGVIHSVLLGRRGEVVSVFVKIQETLLSAFPFPRWLYAASNLFQKGFYQWNLALNFSPMAESAEALLNPYEYKMFPRMLLMARAPNQNY